MNGHSSAVCYSERSIKGRENKLEGKSSHLHRPISSVARWSSQIVYQHGIGPCLGLGRLGSRQPMENTGFLGNKMSKEGYVLANRVQQRGDWLSEGAAGWVTSLGFLRHAAYFFGLVTDLHFCSPSPQIWKCVFHGRGTYLR